MGRLRQALGTVPRLDSCAFKVRAAIFPRLGGPAGLTFCPCLGFADGAGNGADKAIAGRRARRRVIHALRAGLTLYGVRSGREGGRLPFLTRPDGGNGMALQVRNTNQKTYFETAGAGFQKCKSANLLYPGFNPGLFCRAFHPKIGSHFPGTRSSKIKMSGEARLIILTRSC
jgi:hypothetical protein